MTTPSPFNWNGPYFKGAMKLHRGLKRAEDERRNASTVPSRRRSSRISVNQ